jgi:hypothetical protein
VVSAFVSFNNNGLACAMVRPRSVAMGANGLVMAVVSEGPNDCRMS